jgi:hypothetical protein
VVFCYAVVYVLCLYAKHAFVLLIRAQMVSIKIRKAQYQRYAS